jgi:Uma2 family endonuclease
MGTTTLITAEDFARVAPILGPCELVNGEIIQMSPGGVRHSKLTSRVVFLLERYNQASPSGHVLAGEPGIIVARHPDTVRGADVAFVSFQRLPRDQTPAGFLPVAPEFAVEIIGDDVSWNKLEQKIAEYHSFGVDTVWVVDPRMLAVRIYPRGEQPFTRQGADELTVPALPGFRCRVNELFA